MCWYLPHCSGRLIIIAIQHKWKCDQVNGLIIDPHNDQLPVGLIAQLVEHCTSIAEVRVWIPFRPKFFRPLFCHCLSSIAKLWRSLTFAINESLAQFSFGTKMRKVCPSVISIYLWNDLPLSLRQKQSRQQFKCTLKKYYSSQYWLQTNYFAQNYNKTNSLLGQLLVFTISPSPICICIESLYTFGFMWSKLKKKKKKHQLTTAVTVRNYPYMVILFRVPSYCYQTLLNQPYCIEKILYGNFIF